MDITNAQFTILQGIVAHPEGNPSCDDLENMNLSLNVGTIKEELHELAGHGVVERVDVDGETRYRLTDNSRDELQETGLFDAQDTLKHYYEKTG